MVSLADDVLYMCARSFETLQLHHAHSDITPLADCTLDPYPMPHTCSHTVFRRVWDQYVMAMREIDLISNEEQCRCV